MERSASSMDESITSAPELECWSSENLEELRHLLACTSMELESARQAAKSQEQIYTCKLTHLEELLRAAQRERDEARQKAFDPSAATITSSWEELPDPAGDYSFLLDDVALDDTTVVLDLSAPTLDHPFHADAAAAGFFLGNPPLSKTSPRNAAAMDDLEAAVVTSALPERGHLLDAVMQAGPLLHNLMLAAAPPRLSHVPHLPLPRWHHPPPEMAKSAKSANSGTAGSARSTRVRKNSNKSAKTLSAAAADLKISAGKLKTMSVVAQVIGEGQLNELPLEEVARLKKKEGKEENPSDLVRHSAAREVQFDEERGPRFICYRGPPESRPLVPLALVESSFFSFRMNARATTEVEEVDIDTAQQLWNLCSVGWDDEVTQMTPAVNKLFQSYLCRFVSRTDIDGKPGDGVVEGQMVVFEHKLQPADGYFQGLEYLRRRFLSTRDTGFRQPYGLLVLLACPYIQAVAVVMDWDTEKVFAEPLTSFVNCYGAQEFEDLNLLAATLRAVRLFCDQYDPKARVHPAVPFMFRDKPIQQLEERLVFLLEPTRLAKLTRVYSSEAHKLWAKANVAPSLHSAVDIGGGWIQVEMVYLRKEDGWQDAKQVVSDCARDPASLNRLTECIKAAAIKGHKTGYVHGDLRLPNIKLRSRADGSFDVMFIDFDWAGKIGEATYPAVLSPEHAWHQDAKYKKPIEPEHDLHFVNNLVRQV
ncbi:hypothetical protein SELMODRAFT_417464 [Selaginella moellendorffii]|uniref:Protein kinase domain-containing protein n=2 Tax=Selaginella moellendorffii TaxID=88036 RepID=D8S2A9_SELML|nr:hypothetical protein SELMODRAFT_417464 [Selaginella moellendorffii]